VVHLEAYTQARYAQDNAIKLGMTRDGTVPTNEQTRNRESRIVAAEQGLFTALGAALDCTAAVCVAVSGLKLDVQRADMPALLPI
ncbi:hypothetical protein IAE22_35050, partial [Bacillus sp. S34]|nr:hypothetical protein [Bacillus sp. S34]